MERVPIILPVAQMVLISILVRKGFHFEISISPQKILSECFPLPSFLECKVRGVGRYFVISKFKKVIFTGE